MPPSRRRGSSRHLDVVAGIVVAVILIGGAFFWFIYAQSLNVETVPAPAPVPLPKELVERPFNAADGLKQCEKLTPTLVTQAEKDKRIKCYAAVMTVFGTTDICSAAQLDATSASLCASAQTTYEQTRPLLPTGMGSPQGANGLSAIELLLQQRNTNASSGGAAAGSSGSAQQPGTQTGQTPPPSGTQSPTTSTSTTPPPGTVATNTQPSTGSDSGTTSSNGTTPGDPSGGSTSTPADLCILDPGQLVLLQHTNECQ